jgi:hypothetical protein
MSNAGETTFSFPNSIIAAKKASFVILLDGSEKASWHEKLKRADIAFHDYEHGKGNWITTSGFQTFLNERVTKQIVVLAYANSADLAPVCSSALELGYAVFLGVNAEAPYTSTEMLTLNRLLSQGVIVMNIDDVDADLALTEQWK